MKHKELKLVEAQSAVLGAPFKVRQEADGESCPRVVIAYGAYELAVVRHKQHCLYQHEDPRPGNWPSALDHAQIKAFANAALNHFRLERLTVDDARKSLTMNHCYPGAGGLRMFAWAASAGADAPAELDALARIQLRAVEHYRGSAWAPRAFEPLRSIDQMIRQTQNLPDLNLRPAQMRMRFEFWEHCGRAALVRWEDCPGFPVDACGNKSRPAEAHELYALAFWAPAKPYIPACRAPQPVEGCVRSRPFGYLGVPELDRAADDWVVLCGPLTAETARGDFGAQKDRYRTARENENALIAWDAFKRGGLSAVADVWDALVVGDALIGVADAAR